LELDRLILILNFFSELQAQVFLLEKKNNKNFIYQVFGFFVLTRETELKPNLKFEGFPNEKCDFDQSIPSG
jgi:hypothetical protein